MDAPYAWVIDTDLIDGRDVETCGPRDASPVLLAQLRAGVRGERFRMLDDDGEVCYLGRALWFESADAEVDFAPLVDFGAPNAGCTMIEYATLAGKMGPLEAWTWVRS